MKDNDPLMKFYKEGEFKKHINSSMEGYFLMPKH